MIISVTKLTGTISHNKSVMSEEQLDAVYAVVEANLSTATAEEYQNIGRFLGLENEVLVGTRRTIGKKVRNKLDADIEVLLTAHAVQDFASAITLLEQTNTKLEGLRPKGSSEENGKTEDDVAKVVPDESTASDIKVAEMTHSPKCKEGDLRGNFEARSATEFAEMKAKLEQLELQQERPLPSQMVPRSLLYHQLKIHGKVGEPGEQNKLSYVSLLHQIDKALQEGYSPSQVIQAVVLQIESSNLRTIVETYPQMNTEQLTIPTTARTLPLTCFMNWRC